MGSTKGFDKVKRGSNEAVVPKLSRGSNDVGVVERDIPNLDIRRPFCGIS